MSDSGAERRRDASPIFGTVSVSYEDDVRIRGVVRPRLSLDGAIPRADFEHASVMSAALMGIAEVSDLIQPSHVMTRATLTSQFNNGIFIGMRIGSIMLPDVESVYGSLMGLADELFGKGQLTFPPGLLEIEKAELVARVEQAGELGLATLSGGDSAIGFVIEEHFPAILARKIARPAIGLGILIYARAAQQQRIASLEVSYDSTELTESEAAAVNWDSVIAMILKGEVGGQADTEDGPTG